MHGRQKVPRASGPKSAIFVSQLLVISEEQGPGLLQDLKITGRDYKLDPTWFLGFFLFDYEVRITVTSSA